MKIVDNYQTSKITTLGIGGPAKKFTIVSTQEQLIKAIQYAKDYKIKYLVIGGGSNLLIADQGVNELIIQNKICGISHEGNLVTVKAGTPLQELVDYTIKHGLAGLQKLTGIPGTVGGAVYGNAGAYGQTIADCLKEVVVFDGQEIITFFKGGCEFNYRDSIFKKNLFPVLEAKFELKLANSATLKEEAQDTLSRRIVKYPPGIKCPGSFFKNIIAESLPQEALKKVSPDKIVYGKLPAGTLLESVGAKGQKLDGIEIAPYHANLFINKGGGSAQSFHALAKKYALLVKQKFGITLEPEVQLINLPPLY